MNLDKFISACESMKISEYDYEIGTEGVFRKYSEWREKMQNKFYGKKVPTSNRNDIIKKYESKNVNRVMIPEDDIPVIASLATLAMGKLDYCLKDSGFGDVYSYTTGNKFNGWITRALENETAFYPPSDKLEYGHVLKVASLKSGQDISESDYKKMIEDVHKFVEATVKPKNKISVNFTANIFTDDPFIYLYIFKDK